MNQKILLVDDEPAVLGLYKQVLKERFDILTAAGGEDGLAVLRNYGPFAVVISDMQMPSMNGAQFLKRARQLAPNTIRLLLTGHVDLGGAVAAVNEGGIFRLLMKPCDEAVLAEAIASALKCYEQRKEERIRIELPVRLYRTAAGPKVQSVHTLDISNSGARLARTEEPLELGEVLKVECGNRSAPFRVVWVGAPGGATAGQAGLECISANADIWRLNQGQMEEDALMDRARTVQRGLLPQEKPPLRTLEYDGHCIQARMVGGDYYDFPNLAPGEVGFVLADVSGKGVPAALLMASLQGSLRSQCGAGANDLPRLLTSLNSHFCKHSGVQRYVSLFFGRYSDATRTLQYINCGHNPPVLLHKGGAFERLSATAMVLGLFSDWDCSVETVRLEIGDVLGMYTDGVTETLGENQQEFGEELLLEVLRKNRDFAVAQILQEVENAVEQFRVCEQGDDLTLVIARGR
ncbi:MAG TPA: SpoIIE family protein phosphatase [Candidatus Acidoferrum sp.]|nr:SpoIIE family protein phosphatase [Candidatus Acidoferrum sp.]